MTKDGLGGLQLRLDYLAVSGRTLYFQTLPEADLGMAAGFALHAFSQSSDVHRVAVWRGPLLAGYFNRPTPKEKQNG